MTTSTSKILKTGPYLKSEEKSTLSVLKSLDIDVVTLANNHLLDYDEKGVEDTLAFCNENNIQTVGAGMNLEQASKTLFLDTSEGKIAVVNFAENEWSSATENTAGANPMDTIDNANQIRAAKKQADYVFVIAHGGQNYFELPSPNIKKRYRFYVDSGADLVISHHSHSVSGYENYKGKNIYYGLGNFLFTKNSDKDCWYQGMLVEVNISENKLDTLPHPISQSKEGYKIELLGEENGLAEFKSHLKSLNQIILDDVALSKKWNEFVQDKTNYYLLNHSITGVIGNRYLRAALRKLGLDKLIDHKRYRSTVLNIMRCESHRELAKKVLTDHLKK